MQRSLSVLLFLFLLIASVWPGPNLVSAQGTVYTDTMDSAGTGLLSTETFDPAISFAYQGGQFVVDVQHPSYQGDIVSTLSVPELASSRLTVDAFIDGDPANKYVIAGCRHTDAGEGYFFGYLPATGDVLIWRRDSTGDTNIAQSVEPSLIAPVNTMYQIGIDCWTNVITGIVNGQPVLSAFDATFEVGRPSIGLGANGQQTDGLAVAFDNLQVVDRGNLALVAETPATTGDLQMMPIPDPNVDPGGTLSAAFAVSMELPPVVSGLSGSFTGELNHGSLLAAGVQLADFYAEMRFPTPSVPANTAYFAGFCFWADPAGNCYDVYVQDDGTGNATWGYGYLPANGDYQSLQTGELAGGSIDPTPGAVNFLSLSVYQGVAILSGNTFTVATVVPMQTAAVAGDVKAEIGFVATAADVVADPLPMSLSDFSVWDLSPGMAPVSGEPDAAPEQPPTAPTVAAVPTTAPIANGPPAVPPVNGGGTAGRVFEQVRSQALTKAALAGGMNGVLIQEQDVYAWAPGNVNTVDSYTIVTFTNPLDLSIPLDVGIGFRAAQGSESGWRLVFWSDGSWYLLQPGQQAQASGTAPSFDWSPGATNTVELLVIGTTGMAVVNGAFVAQIDLSLVAVAGDVYVGSGFFSGDTQPGRQVTYADWWIFLPSALDAKSG